MYLAVAAERRRAGTNLDLLAIIVVASTPRENVIRLRIALVLVCAHRRMGRDRHTREHGALAVQFLRREELLNVDRTVAAKALLGINVLGFDDCHEMISPL